MPYHRRGWSGEAVTASRTPSIGTSAAPSNLLTAFPNPVPVEFSTTKIAWKTAGGELGQVYLSVDGGPEVLFAQGATGEKDAPWIRPRVTYVFRLYAGRTHATLLDSVTVTRPVEQVDFSHL